MSNASGNYKIDNQTIYYALQLRYMKVSWLLRVDTKLFMHSLSAKDCKKPGNDQSKYQTLKVPVIMLEAWISLSYRWGPLKFLS